MEMHRLLSSQSLSKDGEELKDCRATSVTRLILLLLTYLLTYLLTMRSRDTCSDACSWGHGAGTQDLSLEEMIKLCEEDITVPEVARLIDFFIRSVAI